MKDFQRIIGTDSRLCYNCKHFKQTVLEECGETIRGTCEKQEGRHDKRNINDFCFGFERKNERATVTIKDAVDALQDVLNVIKDALAERN